MPRQYPASHGGVRSRPARDAQAITSTDHRWRNRAAPGRKRDSRPARDAPAITSTDHRW